MSISLFCYECCCYMAAIGVIFYLILALFAATGNQALLIENQRLNDKGERIEENIRQRVGLQYLVAALLDFCLAVLFYFCLKKNEKSLQKNKIIQSSTFKSGDIDNIQNEFSFNQKVENKEMDFKASIN